MTARLIADKSPRNESTSIDNPISTTLDDLLSNTDSMDLWLRSESPAEIDLLGSRQVALRLARFLLDGQGSIGIVGPFGSGKSSIVNWLKRYTEEFRRPDDPVVWFCDLNCWGFEDSASAIQQVLSSSIKTVSYHRDCFSVRHLPEAYRRTFTAGGDWLRTIIDLTIGTADPMDYFVRLSEILREANARLVIVAEELDRTNSGRFERQEVLALLQRLKSLDRFSFVLTGGWTSKPDIDFEKLCELQEDMRYLEGNDVSKVVQSIRSRCQSEVAIETIPAEEDPWKLDLGLATERYDILPMSEVATRLLRTPRSLKHAINRTWRAWKTLRGEVDIDHLLAVSILRHAAPRAFEFLRRNWNQLNDDPSQWQSGVEQLSTIKNRLQSEWKQVCKAAEWDIRAALALIVFLIPTASPYLRDKTGHQQTRLQGITHSRYWDRIRNEEILVSQVRDQDVLRDIRSWTNNPVEPNSVIGQLLAGGDYVEVWEHFARFEFQSRGTQLLELAHQFLSRFQTPSGVRSTKGNDKDDAFIAIWRVSNRVLEHTPNTANWLRAQIETALDHSISLVNDLYYYWASLRYGIVRHDDRAEIQKALCAKAQSRWTNPSNLLKVLHPSQQYDVYQLVFPPGDRDDGDSPCKGSIGWAWLGPILLKLLEANPPFIAPKVACLISERSFDRKALQYSATLSRTLLRGFFGKSEAQVMALFRQARQATTGEDRSLLDQIITSGEGEDQSSPDAAQ